MRIKRFEAPDTQTAMAMIKKELGEDALILSTKKIASEKNGRGGKNPDRIEVLAVVEQDLRPFPGSPSQREHPCRTGFFSADSIRIAPTTEKNNLGKGIHIEGHDLCQRFVNLLQSKADPALLEPLQQEAGKNRSSRPAPDEVAAWRDSLLARITARPVTVGRPDNPAIAIALVGGTGVGKTTTAAKIAAWYGVREGCRVALLSMDCYRIGATDQLRAYARIMRIPCEVALRKKDFIQALARHQDKDLIIIDTAGKSPYDQGHIDELVDWFGLRNQIDPHLVLSATCQKELVTKIVEVYKPLCPRGVILTKLDETRSYAGLCQQLVAANLPVSFLSTGQRIPEDFLLASKYILETLFRWGWTALEEEMKYDKSTLIKRSD